MKESNRTEKSPRLSNSKNLDYFRIAGILIWKSFTFVQKYTRFLEFSHSEHNSNRGNLEIKGVSLFSLLSKICSYFWNSRNREYSRTAGIQVKGVSNLSVKLPVPKELSRFHGELQSEKIPAVIKFQNSGLFENRGNFNLAGFQHFPEK